MIAVSLPSLVSSKDSLAASISILKIALTTPKTSTRPKQSIAPRRPGHADRNDQATLIATLVRVLRALTSPSCQGGTW